jgi:sarcosine oxidase
LWRRLEKDTGRDLLIKTGNLTLGPRDGSAVKGFLASARTYDIAHEELTAAEVRRRWPQLAPPDRFAAGLEKKAGVLFPEAAIDTFLTEAEKAGAILRFDERVDHWEDAGNHVTIRTKKGTYEGGRLLLAAGARNKSLTKGVYLLPRRVAVFWVDPPHSVDYRLGNWPVNFWQLPFFGTTDDHNYHELYALPVIRSGGRVKVAAHSHLVDCDPDAPVSEVTADEHAPIRKFLTDYIPDLAACDFTADVCLYSSTPDGEFALGPIPDHRNVFTAALAGHGFKFAPVLGEILADMTMECSPVFDVSMFSINRFANAKLA